MRLVFYKNSFDLGIELGWGQYPWEAGLSVLGRQQIAEVRHWRWVICR